MELPQNIRNHLILAGNLLSENTYEYRFGNCIYYATSFASFLRFFPEDIDKIQAFFQEYDLKFTQKEIGIEEWTTPYWLKEKITDFDMKNLFLEDNLFLRHIQTSFLNEEELQFFKRRLKNALFYVISDNLTTKDVNTNEIETLLQELQEFTHKNREGKGFIVNNRNSGRFGKYCYSQLPESGLKDIVYYLYKTNLRIEKDKVLFLPSSIVKIIISLPEWKLLHILKEKVQQKIKELQNKEDKEYKALKQQTNSLTFLSNVQFREKKIIEYNYFPLSRELFEETLVEYLNEKPEEKKQYTEHFLDDFTGNKNISENSTLQLILTKLDLLSEEQKLHDIKMGGKINEVKKDTELIIEYTEQIDKIFEQLENLESFLKQTLQTDFQKIKASWENYRQGNITRKDFIKESLELLGKSFAKRIFDKHSPI